MLIKYIKDCDLEGYGLLKQSVINKLEKNCWLFTSQENRFLQLIADKIQKELQEWELIKNY